MKEKVIKPNTQVKILSSEHSRYVQDLAIANGFNWIDGDSSFINVPTGEYIKFRAKDYMTFSVRKNDFDEVFIELPEPSIEAKILAEKVNEVKAECGPELTFDHQGVYKLFNHPEADAICNTVGVNKEEKHGHYFKDVSQLDKIDVYDVCGLFGIYDSSGAIHHAIKKLLCAGGRGHKDTRKDLEEARDSINRKLQMMERLHDENK